MFKVKMMEKRLAGIAQRLLSEVGIGKSQIVVDFGCGSGTYTISVARIVGDGGRVYALDKDEETLHELTQKIGSEGLRNVKPVRTSGEPKIGLKEGSVDVVLLFDVFHDFYFPRIEDRRKLLNEVRRVLKPRGIVSVYPKHIEAKQIKTELEQANFCLEREHFGTLIHDNREIERSLVLNFRKRS